MNIKKKIGHKWLKIRKEHNAYQVLTRLITKCFYYLLFRLKRKFIKRKVSLHSLPADPPIPFS